MRGHSNNNKASAQIPRRSSERTAKTMALSALSTKKDSRKYIRAMCTAPKKRWKAKRQFSAVAEVTPYESLPPSTSVPQIIASFEKHRNSDKKNNEQGNEHQTMKNPNRIPPQVPSLKPLVLARLDLDGAFQAKTNKKYGKDESRIKSLRSCKVTTYSVSGIVPFPVKLYHMVQSSSIEHPSICRWSKDGSSIELNSKNPTLTKILRQHFNHSRWLSFSRQLNNYGFTSVSHHSVQFLKTIYHPKFHRDILDPNVLASHLPYLPGKKQRDQKKKKSLDLTTHNKKKKKKKSRRVLAPKSCNGRSTANTVTPQATAKSSTVELKVTPPRTVTTRIPKKSKQKTGGGKDIKTLISSFKTPSPRYRKKVLSSPPPLSHYLQPPNNMGIATAKASSTNESPLPSSLLTVNFVMSPSVPLNIRNNNNSFERTPRTSNLSSSQSSPMSQDGFKMLSWAAHAVESPRKTIRTPDGKTSVRFMEAMGCSPIVPYITQTTEHRCFPPSSESSSTSTKSGNSNNNNNNNKEIIGPSPLSFRDHEDNEVELELLRNCLEDVFVATNSGNASSCGPVVPKECPSVEV